MAVEIEFDLKAEEQAIRKRLNVWFKRQPMDWQRSQVKRFGDYWKWSDSEIKKWAQGKRTWAWYDKQEKRSQGFYDSPAVREGKAARAFAADHLKTEFIGLFGTQLFNAAQACPSFSAVNQQVFKDIEEKGNPNATYSMPMLWQMSVAALAWGNSDKQEPMPEFR